MDYEKKYKEAKGMAEEIIRYYKEHNRGDETSIEDLEQIFPELKESEDERIRKAIIEFFELQDDNTTYSFIPKKDIIAWLEKQKSVTCNTVDSNNDEKIRKNCIHFLELQKSHHAGTFEIEECIAWLEKQDEQKPAWSYEDDAHKEFVISAVEDYYDEENPLQEELVDWLKSLKNRVQPQTKEWSIEDESYINNAIAACRSLYGEYSESAHWLKSLKDRMQPQIKEWSEDDENLSYWAIQNLTELKNRFGENYGNSGKCIDWLKSLKDRIGG